MKYIEQVLELQRLAYTLNSLGKYTVFADYSGHVNMVNIRVFEGTWDQYKHPVIFTYEFVKEEWQADCMQWFEETCRQLQELINKGALNE